MLEGVSGTKSVVYESLGGETRLGFVIDDSALNRFGVDRAVVSDTVDFILSGGIVGEVVGDGNRARVRLTADGAAQRPAELLRDVTVRSSAPGHGQPVPLGILGHTTYLTVPSVVHTENGELASYVHVDLAEGTDVGAYIIRARAALDAAVARGDVPLRGGEALGWIGQYPLIQAARTRLWLIAPVVGLAMISLLYLQFRSVPEALIVLAGAPFALVGSVWSLYLLGYALSPPVWLGILSVVGLAMQTGVVMVLYMDQALRRRLDLGLIKTRDDLIAAHAEGTIRRLRPKVMTILTMFAALLPLLWSEGAGAEVMRRVGAPMIGGLTTSAFLTLEIIPVLYTIWRARQLRRAQRDGIAFETIVGRGPTVA